MRLPEEQDPRLEHRGADRLAGPGVFVIPYGPVRSGVFEAARFLVQTGGEDVAYCAQRLFFKRRGCERRICEVPLDQAVLVAERVSGTSSVAHALAFSHAIEVLAQTEVPPRAQAIRRSWPSSNGSTTISRSRSASAKTPRWPSPRLSSPCSRNDASAGRAVVGNRYLRGVVVPGGTRIELDTGAIDLIGSTLAGWEREWRRVLSILLRTDSFLEAGYTGPLSEQDARDFGCVARSPAARASTSTRAAIYRTRATRRSRWRAIPTGTRWPAWRCASTRWTRRSS